MRMTPQPFCFDGDKAGTHFRLGGPGLRGEGDGGTASAECKQQHGEKIIEKSLPGRTRGWERSAPSTAFCQGLQKGKLPGSGN